LRAPTYSVIGVRAPPSMKTGADMGIRLPFPPPTNSPRQLAAGCVG
jgi:hypothetical protein